MSYNTLMQDEQDAAPQTPQPETPWQYDDQPEASAQVPVQHRDAVHWTASEFVAHDKAFGWYLILAACTLVVAAIVYLAAQDVVAVVVIILAAIAFGIFAARKPRVLNYVIDDKGLHVEDKTYPYESFKSFSVIQDDAIHSVLLMPMKRFMPSLTIYYAPEDEPRIVDALADYLPFQPAENDFMDRLMRRIRF